MKKQHAKSVDCSLAIFEPLWSRFEKSDSGAVEYPLNLDHFKTDLECAFLRFLRNYPASVIGEREERVNRHDGPFGSSCNTRMEKVRTYGLTRMDWERACREFVAGEKTHDEF